MLLRVNGLAAASSLKQQTPAGITVLSLRKNNDSENSFLTALHEIQFNHGNETFACNSFGIFINDCKHYFIFTLDKFSQSCMREKKRGGGQCSTKAQGPGELAPRRRRRSQRRLSLPGTLPYSQRPLWTPARGRWLPRFIFLFTL